jgi:hypothetical protein
MDKEQKLEEVNVGLCVFDEPADPTEYLTIAQIEDRFYRQWVLIDRPQTSDGVEVLGGYVVCHSQDHAVVQQAAVALPAPVDISMRFIGDSPDLDLEVIR